MFVLSKFNILDKINMTMSKKNNNNVVMTAVYNVTCGFSVFI